MTARFALHVASHERSMGLGPLVPPGAIIRPIDAYSAPMMSIPRRRTMSAYPECERCNMLFFSSNIQKMSFKLLAIITIYQAGGIIIHPFERLRKIMFISHVREHFCLILLSSEIGINRGRKRGVPPQFMPISKVERIRTVHSTREIHVAVGVHTLSCRCGTSI